MQEKRVTAAAGGGSRRHDDPPAWLDKSLPLHKRRELLEQAIRELEPARLAATQATRRSARNKP